MLTLNIDLSPRWITLMPGVEVLVRPMHNGIWLAASEAATAASTSATEWSFLLGVEVAKHVITDWSGVGDEAGNALPLSPEAVTALMHMRTPHNAFYGLVIGPWMEIVAEKKGSAPLSDGTSAEAQTIAAAAPADALNAPAISMPHTVTKG